MFSTMRLGATAHPNNWRNYQGPVHRVLRNGDEVSAWSRPDEAAKALAAAVAAEAQIERGRLPANARAHLAVTDTAVSYAPGGHTMWSVEFALEAVEGAREYLGG